MILLYCLLITPVKIGVSLKWNSCQALESHFGILVWGMVWRRVLFWPKRLVDTENIMLQAGEKEITSLFPVHRHSEKMQQWLQSCFAMPEVRKWVHRSIKTERVQVLAELSLSDAAACALLTSTLNVLFTMRQNRKEHIVRIAPRYDGKSAVRGLCIVRLRLGNLLIAAVMGMAAYLGKKNLQGGQQHGASSN